MENLSKAGLLTHKIFNSLFLSLHR